MIIHINHNINHLRIKFRKVIKHVPKRIIIKIQHKAVKITKFIRRVYIKGCVRKIAFKLHVKPVKHIRRVLVIRPIKVKLIARRHFKLPKIHIKIHKIKIHAPKLHFNHKIRFHHKHQHKVHFHHKIHITRVVRKAIVLVKKIQIQIAKRAICKVYIRKFRIQLKHVHGHKKHVIKREIKICRRMVIHIKQKINRFQIKFRRVIKHVPKRIIIKIQHKTQKIIKFVRRVYIGRCVRKIAIKLHVRPIRHIKRIIVLRPIKIKLIARRHFTLPKVHIKLHKINLHHVRFHHKIHHKVHFHKIHHKVHFHKRHHVISIRKPIIIIKKLQIQIAKKVVINVYIRKLQIKIHHVHGHKKIHFVHKLKICRRKIISIKHKINHLKVKLHKIIKHVPKRIIIRIQHKTKIIMRQIKKVFIKNFVLKFAHKIHIKPIHHVKHVIRLPIIRVNKIAFKFHVKHHVKVHHKHQLKFRIAFRKVLILVKKVEIQTAKKAILKVYIHKMKKEIKKLHGHKKHSMVVKFKLSNKMYIQIKKKIHHLKVNLHKVIKHTPKKVIIKMQIKAKIIKNQIKKIFIKGMALIIARKLKIKPIPHVKNIITIKPLILSHIKKHVPKFRIKIHHKIHHKVHYGKVKGKHCSCNVKISNEKVLSKLHKIDAQIHKLISKRNNIINLNIKKGFVKCR